jgi:hypothetical protein
LCDVFQQKPVKRNIMRRINFLILFILVFSFFSCERDDQPNLIPAGIQTRISGNVKSINGESLSDVEIKIGEYVETTTGGGGGFYGFPGQTNSSYEFKQFVKSVNLTSSGNFDFTFTTSGKGNFYKLLIGDFPNYPLNGPIPFFEQKINDPLGINLTQSANDMTIIGKEFSFNHALKKLYLCEVNMQFNLTNTYPIEPIHSLTYSSNNKEIKTFANPVTIKLFIDKSNPQTLILKRNRNNGIRQKAEYKFAASNVENTTIQNIIVNEADFVDY